MKQVTLTKTQKRNARKRRAIKRVQSRMVARLAGEPVDSSICSCRLTKAYIIYEPGEALRETMPISKTKFYRDCEKDIKVIQALAKKHGMRCIPNTQYEPKVLNDLCWSDRCKQALKLFNDVFVKDYQKHAYSNETFEFLSQFLFLVVPNDPFGHRDSSGHVRIRFPKPY